ncbi:DivIVA domain-containing protein [Nocardioides sp. MAHUQ-72]|uniref:DivIVA domain-containing protein n=1 Tax=unclassified Nocardioides TaxID=2615069 RepID=UPI003614DE9C
MTWFFAVLIVLAMGGVAVLAAGRGAPLAEVYDDRPDAIVPERGALGGDDLRRVRFSIALRGYRMSEVDALLDRLAAQLEAQPLEAQPLEAGPLDPSPVRPERRPEERRERAVDQEGRGDEPTA